MNKGLVAGVSIFGLAVIGFITYKLVGSKKPEIKEVADTTVTKGKSTLVDKVNTAVELAPKAKALYDTFKKKKPVAGANKVETKVSFEGEM